MFRSLNRYISLLLLVASPAWAASVIFQGNSVKALKPNLNLFDAISLLTGSADPTSVATSAPIGSLYFRSTGQIYKKLDSGLSTNWTTSLVPAASPGYSVSGTVGSPNVITAAGGISVTTDQRQLQFVVSSGGAVTVTATPQIQAGTIIGEELVLTGTSDTDYPILADGNGTAQNGLMLLKNERSISYFWNGTKWSELSRR